MTGADNTGADWPPELCPKCHAPTEVRNAAVGKVACANTRCDWSEHYAL